MKAKDKALEALGGMAPSLLAASGFPIPPGFDIASFLKDDEEDERINPFDLLRKYRELESLPDHMFKEIVCAVISNPKNLKLSKEFLDAACMQAIALGKVK